MSSFLILLLKLGSTQLRPYTGATTLSEACCSTDVSAPCTAERCCETLRRESAEGRASPSQASDSLQCTCRSCQLHGEGAGHHLSRLMRCVAPSSPRPSICPHNTAAVYVHAPAVETGRPSKEVASLRFTLRRFLARRAQLKALRTPSPSDT